MPLHRRQRGSDSSFVESFVEGITHVAYDGAAGGVTTPDGCWDIVFRKRRGALQVLQTGLITRPIALDYESGDEYLCVSFRPGVFMPMLPGAQMLDRAIFRPSVNPRSFWLAGEVVEVPTFDNAEGLVRRLVRRGLLAQDQTVVRVLDGDPRLLSQRTVQRHFRHVLGITPKALQQITRARRAVELLRGGSRISDVAFGLGFADQAHLTRSLKRMMGQTPSAFLEQARP